MSEPDQVPVVTGPTRYAVLHGPRSGRGRSALHGQRAVTALRAAGHPVRELIAADAGAAEEVSRAAAQEGNEVLVVVGGDGLVQLAAQACAGTGTAIGIVPTGSGNDTARSLGVPLRAPAAVRTLLTGRRRTIDLIEIAPAGRLVIGSVPAAIDALIAARSAALPAWLGAARYGVATLAQIPRLQARPYRLTLDGEVWDTEALVVTVCNLGVFGGGMRIAPAADPADGLLDVVVIGSVSAREAVRLLTAVFRGRHTDHRAVHLRRAQRVHIEGPGITAYGDGEPLAPLPVTATVRPRALDVVVPAR